MINLIEDIKNCKRCPLYLSMPSPCKPVPGEGPLDAKLMIVGEALGKDESILERPFMGLAGQFLEKVLERAGLSREECYITNVVKCRPTKNGGKANRPPGTQEIEACGNWLKQEIDFVKPTRIITLGMIPTKYFLKVKSTTKLKDLVGNVYPIGVHNKLYDIVPCFHPSWVMQHSKADVETMVRIFEEQKNAVCT